MATNSDQIKIDVLNINSAISALNKIVSDEETANSKLKTVAKNVGDDLKCSAVSTLTEKINKCVNDLNSQIESLKNSTNDVKQIVSDFEDADKRIAQSENLNGSTVYRR
ncbi:hypothetical protein NL50_16355 [Clostridium acetobutylicum]|nr:hypothetical protein NL50_16355 [Clostridium acetobutylicum]